MSGVNNMMQALHASDGRGTDKRATGATCRRGQGEITFQIKVPKRGFNKRSTGALYREQSHERQRQSPPLSTSLT
jgi:hypothetical protein